MLGKLMKYEFNAVSRFLLPLHLVMLLVTFVGRFYVQFALDNMSYRFALLHISLVMFYVLALFAIFVMTYVYLYILRPHKNWFSDEGYLMHTLPVTPAQHIWSKLIVSVCWIIIDLFLLFLSVFLMMINPDVLESWPKFIEMLQEVIVSFTGFDYILGTITYVINLLVSCAKGLLVVYMCMAIGHSFNQYKLLISIAIYIGVYIGTSLVNTLAAILLAIPFGGSGFTSLFVVSNSTMGSGEMVWFDIVFSLVIAVVSFIITQYFLSKQLNLE